MNIKWIKTIVLILVFAGLTTILSTCGGNPAGVPAPPVEMPSPIVLKFVEPADLKIDLSTISMAAPSINVYDAVGIGGQYSDEIGLFGPSSVQIADYVIARVLTGISEIAIPVNDTTLTFEDYVTFVTPSSGIDLLSGTHHVEIDFADYDFNGDGVNEGCSGHTAMIPICVRFWLDGDPFMSMVIEQFSYIGDPNVVTADQTIGIGRFRTYVPDLNGDAQSFAVNYNNETTDQKLVELFMKATIADRPWGASILQRIDMHAELSQRGAYATAKKGVNMSASWGFSDRADQTLQYLGLYLEGNDFWGGSFFTDMMWFSADVENFTNVCARISTGNAAEDPTICDTLGISVPGVAFTRPLVDADVEFYDFPLTPTF